MELNKRKSLLTPAAPTVWGMIHGDITNQQDIIDRITEKVREATGEELTHRVLSEVLAVINPMLGEALEQTQPMLITGYNIKSLKGRSILGEGDLDPLDDNDREMLAAIDYKADKSNTYTMKQVDDLVANVEVDTSNLATKQEILDVEDSVNGAWQRASSALYASNDTKEEVANLRTYVDEQIGGINTMTEEILWQ